MQYGGGFPSTGTRSSPGTAAVAGKAAARSGWECGTCTLQNEGGATSCAACDAPRDMGWVSAARADGDDAGSKDGSIEEFRPRAAAARRAPAAGAPPSSAYAASTSVIRAPIDPTARYRGLVMVVRPDAANPHGYIGVKRDDAPRLFDAIAAETPQHMRFMHGEGVEVATLTFQNTDYEQAAGQPSFAALGKFTVTFDSCFSPAHDRYVGHHVRLMRGQ